MQITVGLAYGLSNAMLQPYSALCAFLFPDRRFKEYEHVGDWLYCKKRSGQVLLHLFDELIKGYSGDIIT